MDRVVVVAERVFAWCFTLALILAAVDWIRPLSVSPFFNVNWLIGLAAVSAVFGAFISKDQP